MLTDKNDFLLEKNDYQKQEESTLKNTEYELIVVISQQGYTDIIMDAARGAGAYATAGKRPGRPVAPGRSGYRCILPCAAAYPGSRGDR